MIVPQATNTNIGNVLVSIHSVSTSFVYTKVIKRKIREILDWFYVRNEYTPLDLLKGIKKELYVLDNDKSLRYSNDYNAYKKSVNLTKDIILEDFPITKYPEFYV